MRWWLVRGAGIPWALRIGARAEGRESVDRLAGRHPVRVSYCQSFQLPTAAEREAIALERQSLRRVHEEMGQVYLMTKAIQR